MKIVKRNYLEIKSLKDLVELSKPSEKLKVKLVNPPNFQLNKFFYKQIGRNHQWNDRLVWDDKKWINYVSNPNVFTFILKSNEDIAGFFELILHKSEPEVEIAYFGLLSDYMDKKLGGYMLTEAIKISFSFKVKRVWVHTCSLDHKNALKNYLSRGMKIYSTETINVKSA